MKQRSLGSIKVFLQSLVMSITTAQLTIPGLAGLSSTTYWHNSGPMPLSALAGGIGHPMHRVFGQCGTPTRYKEGTCGRSNNAGGGHEADAHGGEAAPAAQQTHQLSQQQA